MMRNKEGFTLVVFEFRPQKNKIEELEKAFKQLAKRHRSE